MRAACPAGSRHARPRDRGYGLIGPHPGVSARSAGQLCACAALAQPGPLFLQKIKFSSGLGEDHADIRVARVALSKNLSTRDAHA